MYQPLPSWSADRFEIEADRVLLAELVGEMERCGGAMKPAPGWLLPDDLVNAPIGELLDPWNGAAGAIPLSRLVDAPPGTKKSPIENYAARVVLPYIENYLRSIDHTGLLEGVSLEDLAGAGWRLFDLESMTDFLQIAAFFDFTQPDPLIVEIGGGFGRLIEFIVRLTGRRVRHVNIDAVPVSMMYSHQYLKKHFPDRTVQVFRPDSDARPDTCDFLIVPAWHLGRLTLPPADLGINIESMQEMNQALVDFYLAYLDRSVRDDGIVFLINSREHEFVGDWNIPDTWQCLFRHRTARSWTIDHPTEVFRKTASSQRPQNMLRAAAYWQERCYAELVKELQTAQKLPNTPHGIENMLEARRRKG